MVAPTPMLHYVSRGEGQDVVLLCHGFLGTSRNLVSLARRLAERQPGWRIVLPDLRGHGLSPPLQQNDGLPALADDLAELARAQSQAQSQVLLVGHSLGGRVALVAIDRHPDLFLGAHLLDIAPGPLPSLSGPMQRLFERLMGAPAKAPGRADMRQFFLNGGIDAGLTDWVMTNLDVASDGSVAWRIDRAALARLHWEEGADDLWPAAERQAERLHVVAGDLSNFVSAPDQSRLAEDGIAVTRVAQAGHFLHVDALEATVAAIAERPAFGQRP